METKLEKKTLREWRKDVELQQKELAELVGCHRRTVRKIEDGTMRPDSPSGKKIAAVLGLGIDQILPGVEETVVAANPADWANDGYRADAPKQPLRWWRQKRAVSQVDLARLSGVNVHTIQRIETSERAYTLITVRRKLAAALRIAPDKLLLPGDTTKPDREQSELDFVRSELRGARSALKKARDFMRNDAAITFRHQDARDAILPDIEREVRGL